MIKTENVFPVKIIQKQGIERAELLLKRKDLQICFREFSVSEIKKGGFIILDFGKELRASVRILSYICDNFTLRIRTGESLSETCSELGEKNSTNDHASRDYIVNVPSFSDLTFNESGFRFLRIDCISGCGGIKNVVAKSKILSQKAIYLYNGKDKQIADIFSIAKRTIDLCSADKFIIDGIKRDRLVWSGDIYPEMISLLTLYGDSKCITDSLLLEKKHNPLPNWMGNFPNYSFWWIISVCDYYKKTGKKSFIKKQLNYIISLIDKMNDFIFDDGSLNFINYFVDWQTYEKDCAKEGSRCICIACAKRARELFIEFGIDYSVCDKILTKLYKKEIECGDYKQIIALKYFATGKITDKEKLNLIKGGAKGLSCFMSYFILSAIASFDKEKAICIMKEYYGGMLKVGATTFFEDFNIGWLENSCKLDEFPKENELDIHGDFGDYCYKGFRHSLCHGWSAGVIAFIKENC